MLWIALDPKPISVGTRESPRMTMKKPRNWDRIVPDQFAFLLVMKLICGMYIQQHIYVHMYILYNLTSPYRFFPIH